MRFPYFPRPFIDPKYQKVINIYRPEIPIRLASGHHLYPNPILALLDSGADNNLFPIKYALFLGLKFRKGEKRIITGIGNNQIIAYRNPVTIYIEEKKIETNIDFCECQQTPILGRQDFFKFFTKISFKEKDRVIILNS